MWNMLSKRLSAYGRLIRIDKPVGIFLLLWPTLWALWMASEGVPDTKIFFTYVLGTIFMRSAGCAINDYADRNFDSKVKRTASRPLACGEITPWEALFIASLFSIMAFCLVLTLNILTIKLSFLALFLVISYPYAKRFISTPQAHLGVAFGFGIPMAYASTVNHVPLVALVTMLGTVFWVLAYDTQYAMVDRDDDLKIGIKTTAILFGKLDTLWIVFFQFAFASVMCVVGIMSGFGLLYFMGLLFAVIAMALQYPLIKSRSRKGCFRAFRQNNSVGGIIFLGLLLDLLFTVD
ncbi:4-hydroxybenzoate octaprenyltransferase [Burkholderiales bacterium]|nr:4-hydroxybenzoate octaprenyltransferase [Burkholderiales bacterium]